MEWNAALANDLAAHANARKDEMDSARVAAAFLDRLPEDPDVVLTTSPRGGYNCQ